jgi:hypothetical protein
LRLARWAIVRLAHQQKSGRPARWTEALMPIHMISILVAPALALVVSFGTSALAADVDPPGTAGQQVEKGAQKAGEGISETASGVGQVMAERTHVAAEAVAGAAKSTGRVISRTGRTVGRTARALWDTVRDRIIDLGDDVVRFVKRPI